MTAAFNCFAGIGANAVMLSGESVAINSTGCCRTPNQLVTAPAATASAAKRAGISHDRVPNPIIHAQAIAGVMGIAASSGKVIEPMVYCEEVEGGRPLNISRPGCARQTKTNITTVKTGMKSKTT